MFNPRHLTVFRTFYKVLIDIKLPVTYGPTVTGKCESSFMTRYQDFGLEERDQSFGLRGHLTLTH
jgi:hypothetical protein